eukprot:10513184-Alexandrium_andersonii.AAC.1
MELRDLMGRGVCRSQEGMLILQWHSPPARARSTLHHVDSHLHTGVYKSVSTWKGLSMLPH